MFLAHCVLVGEVEVVWIIQTFLSTYVNCQGALLSYVEDTAILGLHHG